MERRGHTRRLVCAREGMGPLEPGAFISGSVYETPLSFITRKSVIRERNLSEFVGAVVVQCCTCPSRLLYLAHPCPPPPPRRDVDVAMQATRVMRKTRSRRTISTTSLPRPVRGSALRRRRLTPGETTRCALTLPYLCKICCCFLRSFFCFVSCCVEQLSDCLTIRERVVPVVCCRVQH